VKDAGLESNLFIKENVDVFPSDPPGRDANARLLRCPCKLCLIESELGINLFLTLNWEF